MYKDVFIYIRQGQAGIGYNFYDLSEDYRIWPKKKMFFHFIYVLYGIWHPCGTGGYPETGGRHQKGAGRMKHDEVLKMMGIGAAFRLWRFSCPAVYL